MIRNVIFDFGQVLIRFDPAYMVSLRVSDARDAALVESVIFDRRYWGAMDADKMTNEELLEEARRRLPERLWEVAEDIFLDWIHNIPEIDGMREVVRECREKYGARLFLLSNISRYFAEHAHEFPILSEFEDCVLSAVCGRTKPNADIYHYICEKNGLIPSETLFIDDTPSNIAGAEACGIHGYCFDGDVDRLRAYLADHLS